MFLFFTSCLNFLRHKKLVSVFLVLSIMITGVCFGQSADNAQFTDSDMTKNIIEIFNLIFGMLALLLGPMVILAGWLLSPDWTMGDFFGLRPYFLQVWILVSNIVYIIFALMLLYMAIMQIFGGSENEYAFKKKLGPFLVGILIVPFTWLIVSWTLSFANIAVASVLSIPMGMVSQLGEGSLPGKQDTSLWHRKVLPKEFDFSKTDEGYGESMVCDGGFNKKTGARCISPAEFVTYNQAGPFFIIMIYAYNIFKIQDANMLNLTGLCTATTEDNKVKYESSKDCIKSLMQILKQFGLALIVTVFFGIMLIALCWVLLMRAIKLWIYIMLSPLFGLAFFTGEGLGSTVGEAGESGMGSVGFKAFFKLAMVPVLVSAILAFGLLFVGVVRDNFHSGQAEPNEQGKQYCTKEGVGNMVTYCIMERSTPDGLKYSSKLIIGTDIRTPDVTKATSESNDALIILNFGDSFSEIIGGAGQSSVLAAGGGAAVGLVGGVEDIFAHLILTMIALVFMFMGVKVAVQYDEVTKAAFAPFDKLGTSVGNFVAHSPSYLPLPHPAFAALTNPAAISGYADKITQIVRDKETKIARSAGDIFDGQLNSLKSILKDPAASIQNAADKFSDAASKINGVHPEIIADTLRKSVQNVPDSAEKTAFLADIQKNEKSQTGLQSIVGNVARIEALKRQAPPEDRPGMEKIYESIESLDGRASSSSTSRNITVDGGTAKVTGSGNRHIVTIDGVALNISPSYNPPTSGLEFDALLKLRGSTDLRGSDGKIDKAKVRSYFPSLTSDADIARIFPPTP